jgi:hypothetical protein
MGIRDKVFRRTKRYMAEQGLDFATAMKKAEDELGVERYDTEPDPASPKFQGIPPMSFEELLARRQRAQPKISREDPPEHPF